MEVVLFGVYMVGSMLSIVPNALIQGARIRDTMKTPEIPMTSGSKYDVWASAVLHGSHSGSVQSVAFVAPVVLCLRPRLLAVHSGRAVSMGRDVPISDCAGRTPISGTDPRLHGEMVEEQDHPPSACLLTRLIPQIH